MKLLLIFMILPFLLAAQVNDSCKIEVFDFPETEASFAGGRSEMLLFIMDNIEYPSIEFIPCFSEQSVRTYVEFIVMSDGWIDKVIVLRGFTPDFDRIAKELVEKMPRWIPATENGNNVNSKVRLPIHISLW